MWKKFICIFLLSYFQSPSISLNLVPTIHNASLEVYNYTSTIINGTCEQCICKMLFTSSNITALNCFHYNQTCAIFSTPLETNSVAITKNFASSIYFISLPVENAPSTSTQSTTTTTVPTTNLYSIDSGDIQTSKWNFRSFRYVATTTGSRTLKFIFLTNLNYEWYLDDVSVQDSSNEKLLNGNFESNLTSWTSGTSGSCSSTYGISSSKSYSSSNSFYDSCAFYSIFVQQSFIVTNSAIYNISFWVYLNVVGIWPVPTAVTMNVTVN